MEKHHTNIDKEHIGCQGAVVVEYIAEKADSRAPEVRSLPGTGNILHILSRKAGTDCSVLSSFAGLPEVLWDWFGKH